MHDRAKVKAAARAEGLRVYQDTQFDPPKWRARAAGVPWEGKVRRYLRIKSRYGAISEDLVDLALEEFPDARHYTSIDEYGFPHDAISITLPPFEGD